MRIGLCWQGNRGHKGDRLRSIPLSAFEPLAKIEGVQLVSLQKGDGAEQMEPDRDRVPLHVWSDPFDTSTEALLDTAAVMKCLDLVVTCDTAIAHLAGALGVPIWLALPLAGEWRWLSGRDDSPWYPTMRLFRQTRARDWAGVFEPITMAVRETLAGPARTASAQATVAPQDTVELLEKLGVVEAEMVRGTADRQSSDSRCSSQPV